MSDSVLNNIPEGDSIVRSQLTSVLTSRSEILERIQADVPSVIDTIVDEIDKNKSINPASKLYVEKTENGAKPVDWYSWASNSNSRHDFVGGFGGWYKYDYDTLIKENPWVKEVWDSLDKEIKDVFEKKI